MAFAALTIILALLCLAIGVKLLGKLHWFTAWVRGSLCIGIFGLAAFLGAASLDLLDYKRFLHDKPILTISFDLVDEQLYQATVLNIEQGDEMRFEIHGEQWQVDARVIRWRGILAALGVDPAYQLGRISGRYYSLEDERRKPRSVHALYEEGMGVNMFQWIQENGQLFPLIDASYGSATYLPMDSGAIYEVALSRSGLVAKPLNSIARDAIERWN